jgi:hypothetical protein
MPLAANASACPEGPTRRLILGVSATPLIAGGALTPDPAAEACATWLAQHAEHQRLAVEWDQLEGRLHRQHNWMKLSRAQQRRIPEHRDLEDLDDRIEALSDQNDDLLQALPAIVAVCPLGICGKLSVLAQETEHAEGGLHPLILSILRDYRALHEADHGAR